MSDIKQAATHEDAAQKLADALLVASPRLSPPPLPWRAVVIHGSVMLLWLALFARAFLANNVFAWSGGIAYVLYDTALLAFVFWKTLPLARPLPMAREGVRVSLGVIVAAHNEASVLPLTLRALAAQSDAPDEIIIADDGSTDSIGAMLQAEYGLQAPPLGQLSDAGLVMPTLRWLRLPHGGKARALNMALALSRTDTVMTVDADTLLDAGGVAAMRRAFSANPDLVAATGILQPVCDSSFSGRLLQWFQTYEYVRNFLSRFAWGRMDCLLLISGAFGGYRRARVLEVGGFDDACLVEDYELIHRLRRYGALHGHDWHTVVLGDARARTDAPSTIPAFLRQRGRWFGGFLQTQYWYRDMIGNPRFGRLGRWMLPVKAIDTLQPVYGLLGVVLIVLFALGGNLRVLAPVGAVIGAKILLDLGFHLWGIYLYRRWTSEPAGVGFGMAVLSSLAEPFTFQILRHAGASWGWVKFLTGEHSWGRSGRAVAALRNEVP